MKAAPLIALLLVTTLAGVVLAARRPGRGGEVRLPTEGPVGSADPTLAAWPGETLLASLLYDSPYRLGEDGRPRPHLLTAPTSPPDSKVVRVRIRRHAVFHDGTPVTAEHVVSSLGRLAASRSSGWLLAMVEGTAPGERSPSGLHVTSEQFLEIRLETPRALDLLLLALATPQAGVVRSPATVSRAIGTGAFALRRRTGGDWDLRSNRDYFDGPPFLDGVTLLGPAGRDDHIRRLQLGRAEGSLLGDSVYGERPVGRTDLAEGPPVYLTCLVLNESRGALADVRLRRAADLAIDRRRLAGGAARPAGLPGAKGASRQDLARARAEVAAAGGLPGGRHLVLLVDGEDPFGEAIAPLLLRDLAEAGLDAEKVVATDRAARARLTSGSWDLRLVTLAPPSPDGVIRLGQVMALGGLTTEAARLVRGAPADRGGEIGRALATLEARRVVLPLLERGARLNYRPELRGVAYDALGRLQVADLWLRPEGGSGGRP